ncbi:hypothetical protein GCM10011521_02700 [Arenimonas soli]|uniref:Anti-sigma factor n=1 Tax=Arenimonas soli TaxID=2269504 RepID=A0ABQ1HBB7_9GAMM|nr:hypothetical protein [Arenimonas soli]GGA68005.1 hypothetical protein GCM10011521_02700 [Arenimonas soli]
MTDHELRWQLRQLPREADPAHDLWPGIAARLQPPAAKRRRPWLAGLALAACLCLAVGLAVVLGPVAAPAGDPAAELVQREARALTREYEAALLELQAAPLPDDLAPVLATLDASAGQIRDAMAEQPGSARLLDQLKRTYSRRLALTQRAALG